MDDSTYLAARRNVIVIALAIIIFILGDGSVGNSVSLPLGVITLNRPEILYPIAWVCFLWIFIRFALLRSPEKEWRQFLCGLHSTRGMKRIYEKKGALWVAWDRDSVSPQRTSGELFGKLKIRGGNNTSAIIGPKELVLLKLCSAIEAALTRSDFGQYYFPHLLVIAALVTTVADALN